jgi:DNA repair protein RecO (recombination protein O)
MQWTDLGLIIAVTPYGESKRIIHVLTKTHGLYAGLARISKKHNALHQLGNLVQAKWYARLPEQLGFFDLEIVETINPYLLFDKLSLTVLSSLCSIIFASLPERTSEDKIFEKAFQMLRILKAKAPWEKEYLMFELLLLTELGYGLDFSKCVATGATKDLIYLSPKSGCAVSAEAGYPYRDKLFTLPQFLLNRSAGASLKEIIEGLTITGYFIEKHILLSKKIRLPRLRNVLLEMLQKNAGMYSSQNSF